MRRAASSRAVHGSALPRDALDIKASHRRRGFAGAVRLLQLAACACAIAVLVGAPLLWIRRSRHAASATAATADLNSRFDWSRPRATKTLPACRYPPFTSSASGSRGARVTGACIIGERHSGTNLLSVILDANFVLHQHPQLEGPLGQPPPPRAGSVGHGCTAHKHALQPASEREAAIAAGETLPDMSRTLAVIIVRNPFDWALAMCKQPWDTRRPHHMPPHACLARAWHTDQTWPNTTWDTMLDMRAAKYASWLQLRWPYVELVHYECLLHDGGAGARQWLGAVRRRYALRRSAHGAWRLPARFRKPYDGPLDLRALEEAAFPALAADAQAAHDAGTASIADLLSPVHAAATWVLEFGKPNATAEEALGYAHSMRIAAQLAAARKERFGALLS